MRTTRRKSTQQGWWEIDPTGLVVLEAALLAQNGYTADALLRLKPVVSRPGAPDVAYELWFAIMMRERLWIDW
jgi:hypothetical protein